MARSRETKIELTAYDDLFQTDESREEAKLSKIRDIPISEIDEFPDHPFKVLMDEDMEQLVESIKRNGVMTPATVRLKEDGRYELMVTAVYGYLEALKQYQKQKYDLFLLDINLPDGNGLEFCEKIRETSETPVLFLTANDTEEDMLEGFGVGCDDYISKPFSIEVLRKKVLAVLKRSGVGKFRMKYRDLELDKEKCLVLMKGQEIHLTSTEYKLLLYLMENRGRVVTKAMLLEQLWDIDGNFVDDNTVRVNIKRLRQKLNDEKQEYIVTVFGMGYSFGE